MNFALVSQPGECATWRVVVRTFDELAEWYAWQPHVRDGLKDYVQRVCQSQHATTTVGKALELRASTTGLGGLLQVANIAGHLMLGPKADCLANGTILINEFGAFCPFTDGFHSIEVETRGERWPEVDGQVRYLRWQKGGHWYAKIGVHDVVVDGVQKWNSRKQAESAVAEFLLRHAGPRD